MASNAKNILHIKKQVWLGSLLFVLYGCGFQCPIVVEKETSHALLGSWEVKEVHYISKDTTVAIHKAQPGIFIISPKRYSMGWTPTEKPRVPFALLAQPTEAEIISGFSSIVFNAGTYESTDSTLVTNAKLAKVPGFEGGRQYYNYILINNRLFLTMNDEVYPDGTKPTWSGTWKTQFVLEKIDTYN